MQTFQEISLNFEMHLKKNLLFPAKPINLFDPCRSILDAGGKRVRPALCLMGNELFKELSSDSYLVAMAIELFHNFTLIHDDIMDNAPLRRGKPTVHEIYGNAGAILSGDVMNIYAYEYLSKINPEKLPEIMRIFNKAAIEVCVGQQMDMDFESMDNINKEDYINMIALKTSVLLGMSLEAGAILGNASPEERVLIYEFGKNLGLAFQLQDDYLDAFGTQEMIGKLPGGDIRSNKKTYLYISCQELCNEKQMTTLNNTLQMNDEERCLKTLDLYKELGVDQLSRKIIDDYGSIAFQYLDRIEKPEHMKKPLKDLAFYLLNRER